VLLNPGVGQPLLVMRLTIADHAAILHAVARTTFGSPNTRPEVLSELLIFFRVGPGIKRNFVSVTDTTGVLVAAECAVVVYPGQYTERTIFGTGCELGNY